MYKETLAAVFVLASVAGCSTKFENPTDYVTYRHEPLVEKVEDGMTKEQVLTIGGPPSTEIQRTVHPGTCNNYVLNKEGHQQAYYVSFNDAGRVDSKGFMTCEQWQKHEAEAAKI